jgi:outer membrane biosynthesis protein TonB
MSAALATSRRGDMRSLASQGVFATDYYPQLRTVLLQHLDEAHADLLAEPQHDGQSRSIDWYAVPKGEARPLSALAPDEAGALRQRASAMARDIDALADRLSSVATERQALSGQLLKLALQHPQSDDLWSVGGKPVLINWGFAPGTAGAEPQDLSRLGAAVPQEPTPVPEPVPAPEPIPAQPQPEPAQPAHGPVLVPASGRWRLCPFSLSWLLPLLLALLLLWLLAGMDGCTRPALPSGCHRAVPSLLPGGCTPRTDAAALERERARAAKLDGELALLLRQAQERAAMCVPPAPPKVEEPEPAVEPEPEPEPEVVEPFLGMTPVAPPKPKVETPKPAPAPVREPKKVEPVETPKEQPRERPKRKNENLVIPDDAAKQNDLEFLEGCWTSETGLYSHPSNKPIIAEYCFGKNGKGRRLVREQGGQVCNGSAAAKFRGGRLELDAPEARCPDGRSYVPQKVECTGSEKRTSCSGNELGGRKNKWDARFRRKS